MIQKIKFFYTNASYSCSSLCVLRVVRGKSEHTIGGGSIDVWSFFRTAFRSSAHNDISYGGSVLEDDEFMHVTLYSRRHII